LAGRSECAECKVCPVAAAICETLKKKQQIRKNRKYEKCCLQKLLFLLTRKGKKDCNRIKTFNRRP
jgi:hypothetical protein